MGLSPQPVGCILSLIVSVRIKLNCVASYLCLERKIIGMWGKKKHKFGVRSTVSKNSSGNHGNITLFFFTGNRSKAYKVELINPKHKPRWVPIYQVHALFLISISSPFLPPYYCTEPGFLLIM